MMPRYGVRSRGKPVRGSVHKFQIRCLASLVAPHGSARPRAQNRAENYYLIAAGQFPLPAMRSAPATRPAPAPLPVTHWEDDADPQEDSVVSPAPAAAGPFASETSVAVSVSR